MGTVPIGSGEWRRIASRICGMSPPVERSITVSAPYFTQTRSFSSSASMSLVTALLPMFALILQVAAKPMAIGSSSGWFTFAGMIIRPRATSSRIFSPAGRALAQRAERRAARVARALPELLLDAQELVVLRDAIRARRRPGLDLAAV